MIRRFEIYRIGTDAPARGVGALESACRASGRYIPEVLHSKVGWTVSDGPSRLVWEHAFASPESYRRYMVHPYHSNILDRYLLHDSPERVVTDDDLGAGLVGYHCDEPAFAMAHGVRRLVLLRVDGHASPLDIGRLEQTLAEAAAGDDHMVLSTVGTNTLGSAWFDGVTAITGPPRWTHLWEQGFSSLGHVDAYRQGPSPLADAERRGWDGWSDGIVRRTAAVHYEIDGRRP